MATEQLIDSADHDDAPYGQIMFWVFASAVVLVSCLVALIALADSWWMLAAVFAVHLTATAIVCVVIARALTGHTRRGAAGLSWPQAPESLAALSAAAHS